MNEKSLLFDTPSACNETLYNYVENILDGCKTEQNVSESVSVSADLVPILGDPFSQH